MKHYHKHKIHHRQHPDHCDTPLKPKIERNKLPVNEKFETGFFYLDTMAASYLFSKEALSAFWEGNIHVAIASFFTALIDVRCCLSRLQVRREDVLYSFPKDEINVFE